MATRRSRRVAGRWVSARSARKSPTVSGAAGSGARPWPAHHAQKSAQAVAVLRRVLGARAPWA
jgi:hypothetical protein